MTNSLNLPANVPNNTTFSQFGFPHNITWPTKSE